MTIADARAGTLLAGAAADKSADLHEAVAQAGTAPSRLDGHCCWLSVVGETSALGGLLPRLRTLLSQEAIEVRGYEAGARRCTFVIPEDARQRAATLFHGAIWAS